MICRSLFLVLDLTDKNMVHFPSVLKTIPLLLLCFLINLLCDLSYADVFSCSEVNYTDSNSLYQKNINSLLNSLPSHASISKFYNTSTGNDPDRVYALYMCFGFVTIDTCHNCISSTQSKFATSCPNSREAVAWADTCILRYSNENFYGRLNVSYNIGIGNSEKNISDPEKFEFVLIGMLSDLAQKAVTYNVSANNMYATGEAPFGDKTIYAFVQCTADLYVTDCDKCLQKGIQDIVEWNFFFTSAKLLSGSCYLRYEFYAFYNGETKTSIPSSPDNNKGNSSERKLWLIAILTIVSASMAVLLGS